MKICFLDNTKFEYNSNKIEERHRHRFEVSPDMIEKIESAGMKFTGRNPSGRRMEICELDNHHMKYCKRNMFWGPLTRLKSLKHYLLWFC